MNTASVDLDAIEHPGNLALVEAYATRDILATGTACQRARARGNDPDPHRLVDTALAEGPVGIGLAALRLDLAADPTAVLERLIERSLRDARDADAPRAQALRHGAQALGDRAGALARALRPGAPAAERVTALTRVPAPESVERAAIRGQAVGAAFGGERTRGGHNFVASILTGGIGPERLGAAVEEETARLAGKWQSSADAYAFEVAPILARLGTAGDAPAARIAHAIRDEVARERTFCAIGRCGGPVSRTAWAREIRRTLTGLAATQHGIARAGVVTRPFLGNAELRGDEGPTPRIEHADGIDPVIATAVRGLRAIIGAEHDEAARTTALRDLLSLMLDPERSPALRAIGARWARGTLSGRVDRTLLEAAFVLAPDAAHADRIAAQAIANRPDSEKRDALLADLFTDAANVDNALIRSHDGSPEPATAADIARAVLRTAADRPGVGARAIAFAIEAGPYAPGDEPGHAARATLWDLTKRAAAAGVLDERIVWRVWRTTRGPR